MSEILSNPPFPKYIQFETNTVCNARCRMCPHPKMKRKGTAKWSTISKVIRESKDADTVCPFLMQEPMLEPRLVDILANIKQNAPKTQTVLYSNLNKLHDGVKEILRLGLLDELHVSFYGPTTEIYEKWQPPLVREDTVFNIIALKVMKEKLGTIKPKVFLHMLMTPDVLANLAGYNDVAPHVDESAFVYFDTFHGDVPDEGAYPKENPPAERVPCARLWNSLNVHFDGSVVPCCIDWDDSNVLGNVNETSLHEIWTGDKFQAFRKLHLERRWDEIPMCKNCRVHEYQFTPEWRALFAKS